MPVLPNPKHELFAQALAQGINATDAYRAAGYAPSRHHASRLATQGNIKGRVEELTSRVADGLRITQQWLIEKADEVRISALEAGHHAAAVSAIKEIGILSGLRVEKRENLSRAISDLSDEELGAIARGEQTRH